MSTIRPDDELLDVHQVAALLGLKPHTIYKMVQADVIDCIRVGKGNRELRFTRRQVTDYLNRRRSDLKPRPA